MEVLSTWAARSSKNNVGKEKGGEPSIVCLDILQEAMLSH